MCGRLRRQAIPFGFNASFRHYPAAFKHDCVRERFLNWLAAAAIPEKCRTSRIAGHSEGGGKPEISEAIGKLQTLKRHADQHFRSAYLRSPRPGAA